MPFRFLYQNIFNKNESEPGGSDMLLNLVKKYPYFSLAHFFLLKHTGVNEPAYKNIAALTSLHFNNPFLLQDQLHRSVETAQQNEIIEAEPSAKLEEASVLQPVLKEEEIVHIASPVAAEIVEQVELTPIVEEVTIDEAEIVLPGTVNDGVQNDTSLIETKEEKAPVEKEEEPLLFEPLFATDYFASQGIKLREEAQPTDKLGKQLKSFTDWLKTMKKVHESKLPNGSETLDASVQVLAEKSNKEEEVITETMAEVYLQQGKRHKAKEIYEKLSLLNPSKNAYFAAKIDQIQ